MDHVAILRGVYLRAIIDGRKRVEARLSHARRAPFARVATGDRVFLKRRGGGFEAVALVERVLSVEGMSPSGVRRLQRHFGPLVHADRVFWRSRRSCRYATLIWLTDVRPEGRGPPYRSWPGYSPRGGWLCAPPENRAARRSA